MGGRRHPNDWERQREQLSAYIDGELSAAERAELERHIPGCPECQEALGELRRVHDLLAALPMPKAPRSFALPLDTRLDTRPPAQPAQPASRQAATRKGRAGLIQWAGAIAATIGLFLLLSGVVTGLLGSNSRQFAVPSGGKSSDTALTGAQAQTPAATLPGQRTQDNSSTKQPQVNGGATPGVTMTATPTSSATTVSRESTSAGPDIPVLPITGGGLLVLGVGLYIVGRSRRHAEPGDQPAG